MKTGDKLLENYYKGETSVEEEILLKSLVLEEKSESAEKIIFGWYNYAGSIPNDLEASLAEGIKIQEKIWNKRRIWNYWLFSAAASVLLIVGLSIGIRANRYQKMENDFFVMEQALYQVSETIRPEEENDLLILWVDENVEIIIN